MLVDKEVEVKTKIDGVMSVCKEPAIVPFYPETLKDIAETFKNDTNALGCLQRGLTVHYQAVVRGKYSIHVAKDSIAKTELIAKAKEKGYYKDEYATMNVKAIMADILDSI